MKGKGGIYEEGLEREGERETGEGHVVCGEERTYQGCFGVCVCEQGRWWEPSPLGLLLYVGPPNDNMDPPSLSLSLLLSLSSDKGIPKFESLVEKL